MNQEYLSAVRQKLEHHLDTLQMASFNAGYEFALAELDDLSNAEHNQGNTTTAEILRKAVFELGGENA